VKKCSEKISKSGLKLNQVINAIKTFILPKLDYFMMNSVMSLVELKKLDLSVRKAINGLVGGPLCRKICFIRHGEMVVWLYET
jgi:hypothetical protein